LSKKKEMYIYNDFIYSYEGIATGKAVKIIRNINENDIDKRKIDNKDIKKEIEKLKHAIKTLIEKEEKSIKTIITNTDNEIKTIGTTYLTLISDLEYRIINKIENELLNAEHAVYEVTNEIRQNFLNLEEEYFRERAHDFEIIRNQIIIKLKGNFNLSLEDILNSYYSDNKIILVIDEITPSEFSYLKKDKRIKGLILGKGGRTSHMAIMARNLELPTILGAAQIINNIDKDDLIIIDTYYRKAIIINPDKYTQDEYVYIKSNKDKKEQKLKDTTSKTITTTKDNIRIKMMVNIEIDNDIKKVNELKTDGIGLYRTEFIFLSDNDKKISRSINDEEVQFNIYKKVIENIGSYTPFIIRTLDIEKGQIDEEEPDKNPALGMRSIRYCIKKLDIFKTQLRAILRASHYGYIKILFPMITNVEELKMIKTFLESVKKDLESSDEYFDNKIEIGIMLEIPSLTFSLDLIKPKVDFIALGTNDLLQYFFAVDRSNVELNYLYNPYSISFLRFLKFISSGTTDKEIYLCGEITSDPFFIIFSIGIGFRAFSVPLSDIVKIKHIITNLTIKECENFADTILSLTNSDDIMSEFEKFYNKIFKEK